MKKVNSFWLLAVLLLSCAGEKDVIKYAEQAENGLRKTINVGEVVYTVQYKPPAYIARMEHLDAAAEQAREKQLQGMAWFNISFTVKGFNQSPLRYKVRRYFVCKQLLV